MIVASLTFYAAPQKAQAQEAIALSRGSLEFLGDTYDRLEADLRTHLKAKQAYTQAAEMEPDGKVTASEVKQARAERIQSKENLKQGVDALLVRGIPALIEYKTQFDTRVGERDAGLVAAYNTQRS